MSEYQFFEFAALDEPLSDEGMDYATSVTGRAEITSWRWKNVYNWGDFRGSVGKMMQFYDAHVYVANWGTFRFMLALPKDCFDADGVVPYLQEYALDLSDCDGRYVLTWWRDAEGGGEWIDGEGILDGLIPVREELLRGDFRSLYLGWLADAGRWDYEAEGAEGFGDELEPPVPPGLGALTAAQRELSEQLAVDTDFLEAAAELDVPDIDINSLLRQTLERMTVADAREYLLRVAQGQGNRVMAELNWEATRHAPVGAGPRRRLRELAQAAGRHRAERERREAEAREQERREREAKRRVRLAAMLARADEIWQEVDSLAERKTASAYDQASKQLHDLAAAYALADRTPQFQERLAALRAKFARRYALMRRIQNL